MDFHLMISKKNFNTSSKKEIFESRIFLSGENFEEKLKDIKSKAQIMILPGFEWGEKGVIIKE